MPELFDVHHAPGHDGAPGRTTYEPSGRPRDRATIMENHRTNSARAAGRYDRAILGFLWYMLPYEPGGWSDWFRFETDPNATRSDALTCAQYVHEETGTWPAPDTCRRRGTALADRYGLTLDQLNGEGKYRVCRKP